MKTSEQTKRYWRSLADLERTPEYAELMEKEFPAGPEEEWSAPSRRRFLQLMGASLALSAASCRWEKERILPMKNRPEGRIPGAPEEFASALEFNGWAEGVVVRCYEGRPVKVEGNKLHPVSLGASSSVAQAASLEMYDPDRSRGVARVVDGEQVESAWNEFEAAANAAGMRDGDGSGMAVLARPTQSPSQLSARRRFAETFPGAVWVDWQDGHRRNEQDGCARAFGEACRPDYMLGDAKVVLTLDDDLLYDHPAASRLAREFAAGRRPEDGAMSRLWAVEADFSVTGGMADHRLSLRSGLVGAFLAKLEAALVAAGLEHPDAGAVADPALDVHGLQPFLASLADDLIANRGAAVVTVGAAQPADVHARAQRLNVLLDAQGKTVRYLPAAASTVVDASELKSLADGLRDGNYGSLLVLDANPAYDMPGDLDFGGALEAFRSGGGTVVHLGLYRDETARHADWHLPMAHAFETWTDAAAWDGTVSVGQPLIDPLYDGRSVLEMLSWWTQDARSAREQVRAGGPADGKTWRRALHDGVVADSAAAPLEVAARALPAPVFGELAATPSGGVEVRFVPDRRVGDGRYANLGWLQELPDPMTKMTWDNAALMSFATAEALGVEHGTLVRLSKGGRSAEVVAYLMPGHADGCVTVQLGFGRTAAGHVAGLDDDEIEPVGFDVNPLRAHDEAALASGVAVEPLGTAYELAITQDHFAIDEIGTQGRDQRLPNLVKEGTVDEWQEQPLFAKSAADYWGSDSNLWQELDPETDDRLYKPKHKWGMAIDLSTCTGCSACTIACQAENNIPVVGKDQVLKGREMHWIRMDRYFTGDPAAPQVMNQPVACQHCEMAPCESVCPVAATVHSSEGLNDMVYNRCIGTRYCSNNCPYKVRRFNFFDYNEDTEKAGNEVMKMAANPEVTVRARGVMEKCTFCVQRIERARITHRNEDRDSAIPDGAIETACQQACPTGSIAFGDLMDEQSAVRKWHENPRSYAMLAELNNKPRNLFLARIRNPHPDMPVAEAEEAVSHG